jgi:hypothetical protein
LYKYPTEKYRFPNIAHVFQHAAFAVCLQTGAKKQNRSKYDSPFFHKKSVYRFTAAFFTAAFFTAVPVSAALSLFSMLQK